MKKTAKKLIMMLVVLAVVLTVLPAAVGAASSISYAGMNIVLGDNIGANFYLTIPEADVASTTVTITVADESYTTNASDASRSGDYYVFSVGLAAAQMTDEIQISADTNGSQVELKTTSIYNYATQLLADDYEQDMKDLVLYMLNYGATAQTYFAYNADNLATAGVTVPTLQDVPNNNSAASKSGSADGVSFYGCSMIHRSRIGVRFYFDLTDTTWADYTVSSATDSVSTGYSAQHGRYYVQIMNINPHEMDKDCTVTVTDKAGNSVTITYSPMYYITRMAHKDSSSNELKEMMKALYNYHLGALEYIRQDPTVYDIFDLTGATENTIKGTNDTFDGQIHANISADHKENMAFKTKLTMGAQNVRLSLNAKDGADHYDPVGYAVYLYGADNSVEIRRNNAALATASVQGLAGTYVFETGIVDIMLNGERAGKHLYVKINDVVVCEYDDMDGYLTGDALGTKIVDFHYGAATQMDTTYTVNYGNANVYTVQDLTGNAYKVVSPWGEPAPVIGNINAEDKEQAAFNFDMNIANARQRYRFSVGALESHTCIDPCGYGLEIAVQFDGNNHVKFTHGSGSQIAIFNDVSALIGAHNYEFGYRSITVNSNISGETLIGKQVYLNVDGTVLHTYDDKSGYLTGDTVGTKVALHQSAQDGSSVLLNASDVDYSTVKVYDIYDLTGVTENTINGTGNNNWNATVFGNIDAADKENVALKANIQFKTGDKYRFSLSALESYDCVDPAAYGLEISLGYDNSYHIAFVRNATTWLASYPVTAEYAEQLAAKTVTMEFGYRDIISNGTVVGKQVYLSVDGVVQYSYNDYSGYLTGDALGTKTAIFYYGSAIQLDTTYNISYSEPKVYDIYDLTGEAYNTIQGTDVDYDGRIYADVSAEHKENMAFITKLTMGEQEVRLSLNALDGASIYDAPGYAVYLYGASNTVDIRRNNTSLKSATVNGLAGTYIFEAGIVDMLWDGQIVGKHLYVKINDVVVCQYDDMDGYLTGDALGTKIVDFHYGAAIQMDSTYTFEKVYGNANVYDIYDLSNAIATNVNAWASTKLGSIAVDHKEQAAIKMNMNIAETRHRYRFSVGAAEGVDCTDPKGYGLEITVQHDGSNAVKFIRGSDNKTLATYDVSALIGEHTIEFGYRNITKANVIVGKQVYLSVDGADLYTYDDMDGYLTGDSLGTMVALFHNDDAVTLNTTYAITYGTANVYDISDLTGGSTVTLSGTASGATWENGQLVGNITGDKENAALHAKVTTAVGEKYRLSMGALDSQTCVDVCGYGIEMNLGRDGQYYIAILRNNSWLTSVTLNAETAAALASAARDMEFGYRDILCNGNVVGKQVYLSITGLEEFTYNDYDGYLTGDTLGTKVAVFTYGQGITLADPDATN